MCKSCVLIQYYLKIYEDIHRLRDYCRDEYFEKLEEKVGKQRKNMQKKRSVSFANPLGVCVIHVHVSGMIGIIK